jgi:hypothetical protein
VLIVGSGCEEAEGVAANAGLKMIIGDDTTINTIINIKPSFSPDKVIGSSNGFSDECPIVGKYYRLFLTNPAYLHLETLVSHISHISYLELSQCPFL